MRQGVFPARSKDFWRARLTSQQVRAYVQQQLRRSRALELIAGRLKRQQELPIGCHESIYQDIYLNSMPHE